MAVGDEPTEMENKVKSRMVPPEFLSGKREKRESGR